MPLVEIHLLEGRTKEQKKLAGIGYGCCPSIHTGTTRFN